MSDVAVRVENLGKLYQIGEREPYRALRDTLTDAMYAPIRTLATALNGRRSSVIGRRNDSIWALKDVSFEVKKGEVVGIIGRNGAGKSTLLKILSRITEPTEGHAAIHGRVGSLLEVGTGFHPELTGRENIYLNGAILGMRKAEIEHKFDEIVAFAEIEKFIDTPVKRYSSGMYVRLAFAVAAHLEPEILLVDEVLAVGDAAFQKKCLGKMDDVAKEGRTILFVSHNMGAVSALCRKAIFLDQGLVTRIGHASQIIEAYLCSLLEASKYSLRDRRDRDGTGRGRITHAYLAAPEGTRLQQALSGYECILIIGYEASDRLAAPVFKFTVYNSIGQPLLHFDSSLVRTPFHRLPSQGYVGCRLQRLPLSRGTYRLNVSIEDRGQLLDHVIGAYSFVVEDGNFHGDGRNIVGLREVCLADQEWIVLNDAVAPIT